MRRVERIKPIEKEEVKIESPQELEARLRKEFPIFFIQLNEAQDNFIRIKNKFNRTPRRRLFEAGNKIGKCNTYQTLIETIDGEIPVGKLFKSKKPFLVWSWNGERKVAAHASAPFKKDGLHKCYRITLSDGRWVESADHHLILCADGHWQTVESLYESFQSLRESSLEYTPLIPLADDLSYCRTGRDYQGRYSIRSRQYGEQPHVEADNDQFSSPLQADVQKHSVAWYGMDEQENKYTYNSRLAPFLHATKENLLHHVGQFAEFLSYFFCRFVPQQTRLCVDFQQPCAVATYLPRPCDEYEKQLHLENGFDHHLAYRPPLKSVDNFIISIEPIGCQEVYDFEVKKFHNYFAGGLIHHNTMVSLIEDLAHSFGFRPWLLPEDPDYKVDIKVPNIGMIGCETHKNSVKEKIEPTLKYLVPSICQAVFKPGPTGVLSHLILPFDAKGGKCGSEIYIRSYNEDKDSFEGIDYDWIHWDEPPPEDIFKAAERGKVVTNAPSWFSMTPLKEAWIYQKLSSRAAMVI